MKLNWGTGIVITYSVFVLSMILFVVNASQQNNDLVNKNYYDEAVNYQEKIDATNNNALTGNHLDIEYIQDEKIVVITYAGNPNTIDGDISFYKPDQAEKDFIVKLKLNDDNKLIIPSSQLSRGAWEVKASYKVGTINCYYEQEIFIQ